MDFDFIRDTAGIAELEKSDGVAAAVKALAVQVAANAESQHRAVSSGQVLPVKVDTYTTDRAAASVTLAHPAGLAMQAKYGVLTKAAAGAGLEVKS